MLVESMHEIIQVLIQDSIYILPKFVVDVNDVPVIYGALIMSEENLY